MKTNERLTRLIEAYKPYGCRFSDNGHEWKMILPPKTFWWSNSSTIMSARYTYSNCVNYDPALFPSREDQAIEELEQKASKGIHIINGDGTTTKISVNLDPFLNN